MVINHYQNGKDRRAVKRLSTGSTSTAEIKLSAVPVHQLKLRDSSLHGACLLIKKESAVIKHLAIDQMLTVRFQSAERSNSTGVFKIEIKHITEAKSGRYQGHYLVGVKIIERMTAH